MVKLSQSGVELSSVIMGTWQADQRRWPGIKARNLTAAYQRAWRSGVTTFDTAEVYADSERLLQQTFGVDINKIVLLNKVFCNHLRYNDVIGACERSLITLGRDYFDLYQIHWPSGTYGTNVVPIEETLAAMNALKSQGKIRSIGVSNFSYAQLKEARLWSEIESIQLPYSLLWRHLDRDIRHFCEANQIVILGYSALAQGMLSGHFSSGHVFDPGDNRQSNVLFSSKHIDDVLTVVDQYKEVASELNASVGALALAWVFQQPNTAAIVGAKRVRHVDTLLEALNLYLDEQTHLKLSMLSPNIIESFYCYSKMWQ